MFQFYTPWKLQKNCFSCVFRGYKMGAISWKGLMVQKLKSRLKLQHLWLHCTALLCQFSYNSIKESWKLVHLYWIMKHLTLFYQLIPITLQLLWLITFLQTYFFLMFSWVYIFLHLLSHKEAYIQCTVFNRHFF